MILTLVNRAENPTPAIAGQLWARYQFAYLSAVFDLLKNGMRAENGKRLGAVPKIEESSDQANGMPVGIEAIALMFKAARTREPFQTFPPAASSFGPRIPKRQANADRSGGPNARAAKNPHPSFSSPWFWSSMLSPI